MADLKNLFIEFVKNPTRETYLRAWNAQTTSPQYNPYGDDLTTLEEQLNEGNFQQVIEMAGKVMPAWVLAPRIHWLLSAAHRKLGDDQKGRMETAIATVCTQGIQSTGDGSEERPYLVTCTTDEYDLLNVLQKQLKQQSLIQSGSRWLDRLECDDGAVLHFDITRPYLKMSAQFGNKGDRPN